MTRTWVKLLLIFSLAALAGCAAKVVPGKVVKLNYKGTLADGTVFDSSEGQEPLEFRVGGEQVWPAFEQNIIGMVVGGKKTFTVKAAEAYGERDEGLIVPVPKTSFPDELMAKLTKGMELVTEGPNGTMVVKVAEVGESSVMIDYNHPLAGKDLTFEITLLSMRDATKDELAGAAPQGAQGSSVGEPAAQQPAPVQ